MSRRWTREEQNTLAQTPSMLMIDRGLRDFDPTRHRYLIFNLSESAKLEAGQFRALFQAISESVATDGTNPFEIAAQELRKTAGSALQEAIELKPGWGGFAIDLKKILSIYRKREQARRIQKRNQNAEVET